MGKGEFLTWGGNHLKHLPRWIKKRRTQTNDNSNKSYGKVQKNWMKQNLDDRKKRERDEKIPVSSIFRFMLLKTRFNKYEKKNQANDLRDNLFLLLE